MRTVFLTVTLSLLFFGKITAQCDIVNGLQLLEATNQVVTANMECTDAQGWTHYFNSSENKLILSIKKNGQNIGATGLGLIIQSGTLSGYGGGGYNLSNADYIANDIWIAANRFWQVTGANEITSPVQVRFYFSDTDVDDIAESVDDYGFFVDEPDDVLAFTLGNGNGIWPYAETTQPDGAVLTLYDMVSGPAPDWASGTMNGFHFAEFSANNLDVAGSLGFLIFQADPPVSVAGQIARPNGVPVQGVTVEAASTSIDVTGANGQFVCPTLITGGDYEIVPSKNVNPAEGVNVADLIRLARHLLGNEPLVSAFERIAADADDDTEVTFDDLDEIRKIILGKTQGFPNSSWRFVREGYVFPNPTDPFTPPFPETIPLTNLPGALNGQNFVGVKIGDVAEDSPLAPPPVNPLFSLPSLTTCNPGDELVFPITVTDFQNIRGFQFTLEWDVEVMEFVDVENLQLPGLTQQSVGTESVDEGKLAIAWFNPADVGSSLNNGGTICEIRFASTGAFGASTPLNFTSSIADVLLLHQNLSEDTPTLINGGMVIENNSVLAAGTDITHAGCNGEPIGSIDLTVNNATAPVTYEWSTGATSEDISGLGGGEYRVTVSDASGNCPKVFFATVAPNGPIEISGQPNPMSCPNVVDGSIDLEVPGGPYTYAWSNGSTEEDIDGLFMGNYEVTVTDLAGCTATASFSIGNPNMIQPSVDIVNASSEDGMDGAVGITTIGGGTPPFDFEWSTGETSQSIQNLNPGDYFVTITDGIGCSHVFGYIVSDLMTATGESEFLPSVNIFPNPVAAGQVLSLDLRSEKTGTLEVEIQSTMGQVVSVKTLALGSGNSTFKLPMPDEAGLYFLQIKMNGEQAGWAKVKVVNF